MAGVQSGSGEQQLTTSQPSPITNGVVFWHMALLENLVNCSEALHRSQSLDEVIRVAGEGLVRLTGAEVAFVFLPAGRTFPSLSWEQGLTAEQKEYLLQALQEIQESAGSTPGQSSLADGVVYIPNLHSLPPGSALYNFALTSKCRDMACWRLPLHNHPSGWLICAGRECPPFSPALKDTCLALCRQAGIAFENLLNRESSTQITRRRAQEAENLRLATEALTSSLDLDQVLKVILERLDQVVHHDSACIFLYDGVHLKPVANKWHAPDPDFMNQLFDASTDELFREVQRTHQPLIINDADKDPRFKNWGGISITRGWMGIPLIAGGEVTGILTLDSKLPGTFTEDQAILAQAFASHAAVAMRNAQLYQAERQHARELEALQAATALLVTTLDPQVLVNRILAGVINAIPNADAGSIYLVNPKSGQIQLTSLIGYTDPRIAEAEFIKLNQGYTGKALRTRQPVLINNVQADPDVAYDGEIEEIRRVQSAMSIPLLHENQVLGIITVDSFKKNAFTESNLRLVNSIASTAVLALQNARLHAEVQQMAITDPLTNLFNRRGLNELGKREFERARRFNRALSVIMLDIDHFKQVNDQYGHETGDSALRDLSTIILRHVRDTDLVCRYGGEEFVILLPETETHFAFGTAERLRLMIADHLFQSEKTPFHITISLGVSTLTNRTPNLDSLIQQADRALYCAKEAGRNRVISAS